MKKDRGTIESEWHPATNKRAALAALFFIQASKYPPRQFEQNPGAYY